jgi:thymidylate synthase ThyX
MGFDAQILADSVSSEGYRLTTLEVTFPRFVLAEFNTHRVFSRNSASSRAVPVAKQLRRVLEEPYVPIDSAPASRGCRLARRSPAMRRR